MEFVGGDCSIDNGVSRTSKLRTIWDRAISSQIIGCLPSKVYILRGIGHTFSIGVGRGQTESH